MSAQVEVASVVAGAGAAAVVVAAVEVVDPEAAVELEVVVAAPDW